MKRKFLNNMLSKYINTNNMQCREKNTAYLEYLENNLDNELQQKVEEHLKVCSHCRIFVEKLREVFLLIENEKIVKPDHFMFTRIQAKLSTTGESILKYRAKAILQTAAAIILMLFGIYSGIIIGKSYDNQNYINSDYQTEIYYLYEVQNENLESVLLTNNPE